MGNLQGLKRTHYCGKIDASDIGQEIVVMGWVQKWRDLGGVVFIDVRDRSGIVQAVFNPGINDDAFERADQLRSEYVIAVEGEVKKRPQGNINREIPTGEIEIEGSNVIILNKAKTPPISIDNELEVTENLRLKYRYLDLRRPCMKEIIHLRHKAVKTTRDYLDDNDFWEIETPILTKSTPEGARDYLVPSRLNPGKFYALPQSPQIFKQLLMIGGMDRYFQITRCFRDEDLRANRQPEFTQIDIEMSFIERSDVFNITEGLMKEIFSIIEVEVPEDIPVLSYDEAMDKYGSDKPDLRFEMKLHNISDLVKDSEFNVFSRTVAEGGEVKGIKVVNGADYPRTQLDQFIDFVKIYRAKGLVWIAFTADEVKSPVKKYLSESEIANIKKRMKAATGDLLLFVADKPSVVAAALGNLRLEIARKRELIPENDYKFAWIVDFPLIEYDEERGKYMAKHHPFTAPLKDDISLLDSKPEQVRANAYDLVLNGEELGGGSIRIDNRELQQKVFNTLGIDSKEANEKFGFLLEAFDYGTPPHGGIAFGMDRIVMILSGTDSIRDVIPFPKTQKATSLLTDAPSVVDNKQLEELKIEIKE